jgi:hypothetical protein
MTTLNKLQSLYKCLLLAIIGLAITITSCNKSYLNTTPTGILTSQNFWQSQEDALAGVNACYATLRSDYLFGTFGFQMMDLLTPNAFGATGVVDQYGYLTIAQSLQNSSNTVIINNRWGADYQGIGRVNSVIYYVPKIKMDTALRSRITGEAYFLRAFYYQDLVCYYGSAPLILAPPDINQASLPRTGQDSIITQIYKDLDSAAAKLPVSYSSTDVGRATRGAALALKARVALYRGDYTKAASLCQSVMNLAGSVYTLFPDYRGLFLPANKNNKEVIFDVQFSLPNYGNSFDVNSVKYQNAAPSQDLVNAYLCTDGLPTATSPLYNSAKPYNNRDSRLLKSIALPGYYFRNVMLTNSTFSAVAVWKKSTAYLDSTAAPSPDYTDGTSSVNFIVMRYAEVLLNYAEAQNEAVGPDATVYAALDAIRMRAGMAKVSVVNPGLTQSAMRDLIRLERRIELAGEGLYYNDIRRWKTAETVMLQPAYDVSGKMRQTRGFQANRDYLWPVPSVQRQQNPALTQNPNYPN